ncbi:hypothetical protein [Phytohabitans rumicis]|uniref:Cytochrome P450 n=1 Tax=Phytohabitans rumicis TaxID=1076125 RepID=A0A6V8LJX2_9ACTN|nr:hypothetical protein [Phytohabitans rumicis]GFJ94919.1 hypothetical protein Prum_085610 [Phytohabitans rumicis]
MEIVFSGPDDVRAVLADPRFVPPPPGAAGPVGTMAWLRSAVVRFSHGVEHARRRALVVAELATLDPADLRQAAAKLTAPATAEEAARTVPVAVLASALGVPADRIDAVVTAVAQIAAVYLSPGDPARERVADTAVASLLADLEVLRPESTGRGVGVARISILVQAYVGTGVLIREGRDAGRSPRRCARRRR